MRWSRFGGRVCEGFRSARRRSVYAATFATIKLPLNELERAALLAQGVGQPYFSPSERCAAAPRP